MIPVTPETPEMVSGNGREKDSGNSGILIDTGIPESREPVRLLLGKTASDLLTDTGEKAFAIVGKAMAPEHPGRWAIFLIPCDLKTADSAVAVARGEMKATRIQAKKPCASSIARGEEKQTELPP